jgi:hypothetical protein
VSLEKKEVWMKYRTDKTTKESLQQAIEKLGYTAAEKKPDKLEIKNWRQAWLPPNRGAAFEATQ